jgi:hypothetical protein
MRKTLRIASIIIIFAALLLIPFCAIWIEPVRAQLQISWKQTVQQLKDTLMVTKPSSSERFMKHISRILNLRACGIGQ